MQEFLLDLFTQLKEGELKIHEYQYDVCGTDVTAEYIEELKSILLDGNG